LKKENARLKEELAGARVGAMLSDCMDINGLKVVAKNIPGSDIEELIKVAAEFSKMPDVVTLLASDLNGAKLVAAAGKKAIEQGVNSGVIVKEMCKVVGGGGGGRADMAQGGGPDVKKIDEALKRGVEVVNQIISRS